MATRINETIASLLKHGVKPPRSLAEQASQQQSTKLILYISNDIPVFQRQSLKPKIIQSRAMSSHKEVSDTFRKLSKTRENAPLQIVLFLPSLCPGLEVEIEHSLGRYNIGNWDRSGCHHRQVSESHGLIVELHRRFKVD